MAWWKERLEHSLEVYQRLHTNTQTDGMNLLDAWSLTTT